MSRRDVEELIKQLQDVAKDSPDRVSLDRPLFDEVVTNLGRLEQALDNRPSLIKKLNEKIIKLEGELEILRNETRVSELEKKVQRLEGELQRSYATKNFTLKNGLLEIEKAYRDFISGSPAVQGLWDEITLLLVEDKESLPQHILQRRNTLVMRGQDAESAAAAAATDSPAHPPLAAEGSDAGPHSSMSYVQQQVDKFKDYNFTPGAMDPHDPNHPANLHPLYSHHHFPGATPAVSYGGAPDARAGEPAVDDRPTGLDERLTHLREQYNNDSAGGAAAPALEPHWGSVVPAPSPLRPVSLFSAEGDGKPPDASALEACRDELNASLEHLRALFAQYDWAPTPLPGAAAAAAAAGGAPEGGGDPQQQQGQGAGAGAGREQQRLPDASAFTSMADSLEVSVERLREYFAKMHWAPGGAAAAGSGGSGEAQEPGAAVVPDARYFDSQAEVILASVHHLRLQFQEAAAAAAAAAAAQGNSGTAGTGSAGGGGSAGRAAVIPDASYFETQADAIAASVNELLRLYERSAAAATDDLRVGAGGGLGPWASAAAEATAAVGGGRAVVTPDARAGDAVADEYDASVQPLVDLFSSFMTHMAATRGIAGASGPWPVWYGGAPKDVAAGAEAVAAYGGEGAEAGTPPPPPNAADLIRLFAKFARAWPAAAAAAAAMRTPSRTGSVAAGGLAAPSTMGGVIAFPDPRPPGELQLLYGAGGAVAAAAGPASPAPPPAVRFHIRVNASDAGGGGAAVTAHLSPAPSATSLADGQRVSLQRHNGADIDADGDGQACGRTPTGAAGAGAAADGGGGRSPAPAAAPPVEVLLASLEARHGRGLAASPEAVAVWRDLLALLGVDPDSRPPPTHGSPLPTPLRRSVSSTPVRATPEPRQADAAAGAVTSDAAGAAGWASVGEAGAGKWLGQRSDAEAVGSADAWPAGAGADADDGLREPAEVGPAADLSREALRQSSSASVSGQTTNGGDAVNTPEEGAELGRATGAESSSTVTAAVADFTAAEATEESKSQGERLEGPSTPEDAARDAGGYGVTSDVDVGSDGGAATGMRESADAEAAAVGGNGDGEAAAPEARGRADGQDGEQTSAAGADADADTDVDAAAATPVDNEGPGLVAGGVRFQITLSEITPAVEESQQQQQQQQLLQQDVQQQQQQQPLLQFRANVHGGGGVDPEVAATAEAELTQLRQVRQNLSEQLASTQELVWQLNRQLKLTLESREDLATRVETLGAELSTARADATEARHESDMFMRELVDAKVQLAEVQGEYMQVYLALKKALGNEKGMIAKIDELERILAVVGPGDVSVDDEYGSTVGQVSAMATPRDDGGEAGPASEHGSHGGGRSEGGVSGGRRSMGDRGSASATAIALRKASSGGSSLNGGSGPGSAR